MIKKLSKFSVITVLFFAFLCVYNSKFSHAKSSIIGNWTSADNKLRYDFLEGFAPKRGVVIQYENGNAKSVKDWKISAKKIKIGYYNKKYEVVGDSLIIGKKTFKKIPKGKFGKIIELKKEPQIFIDSLVDTYWLNPIAKESYQYKKGFSSTSGIYSLTKDQKRELLGSWSFANGVIKIDRSIYPNGRITGDFLILLTSRNKFTVLKRGKKSPTLQTVELKKKGKEFIRKLVSGRWVTPSSYGTPDYKEFRPIFGDLSGVVFNFDGPDYTGSSKWEYSLKTGSIKIGYPEYPNAQIQGPYLILLNKNGKTDQFVRPQGENITEFTHVDVKRLKVTETDTKNLRSLLERQWYLRPYTYKFIFEKNEKEGWLHQFRSYPFVVSGNTLKIKDFAKVKDIRFVDGKIVLGNNKKSYFSDSKIVRLAHQGEEEATKLANIQKKKLEEFKNSKLVLKIKMKNGESHVITLPVGEMKNVVSLSVEPGM